VLILKNAIDEKIIRRDLFANRDAYNVDTPWGGKRNAALTDDDVAKLKYWLGQRFRFEPGNQVIFDALVVIACENAYDPVCDTLDALPAWDKKPRLGTWLAKNFEAKGDPEYLSQVFTKWMVAMIGRAKMPGLKFDWMPIFEGAQGIGKSSFGKILVGEKYFLDWLPNLGDKDSALGLQGMWAVEMGELANMRKTEIEIVKAFITRQIDKIRPPYGKRWIESPRRCVFFGTTNRSTYLTDDTGNRRSKPVEVGRLEFEVLRAERDQLFAEALTIWSQISSGERRVERYFDLTGDALIFEAQIHQKKMVEDEASVMKEAFEDFVEKCRKGERKFDFKKFRILELFGGGGPLSNWKQDNRNCQFAAKMLKKLGGQKHLIKGLSYWGVGFDEDPHTLDFY
jgi:predicted P-loop ATPase